MGNSVKYSTSDNVSICTQCGSPFRQVWKPASEEYTSFKECPHCRTDDIIVETVIEILEFVGNKKLTIKEIREILKDAVQEFEKTIEKTVICSAKRAR